MYHLRTTYFFLHQKFHMFEDSNFTTKLDLVKFYVKTFTLISKQCVDDNNTMFLIFLTPSLLLLCSNTNTQHINTFTCMTLVIDNLHEIINYDRLLFSLVLSILYLRLVIDNFHINIFFPM